MGSRVNSSYKSIGIKCIKCYFSYKICLWHSNGDGSDNNDNDIFLYKKE